MNTPGWLLAIHLLGAVIWVGGVVYTLLVVRPAVAILAPPARLAMGHEALRRFYRIVWHVMPIVLLTGYAMLFGVYGGFAAVGWPVHVMHLTGLLMSGLFVAVFFGPFQTLKAAAAAQDPAAGGAAMAKVRQMMVGVLILGLVTVVVAAFGP
jgi:uncharacterized membrane protein